MKGRYNTEEGLRLKEFLFEILKTYCTDDTSDLHGELRSSLKSGNKTNLKGQDPAEDAMAVVYIVFVLLFFSTSLLIVLVKYVRRERETVKLEKFYQEYMKGRHSSLVVHFDEAGRRLSSVPHRKPSTAYPTPTPTPTPTPAATPTSTPSLAFFIPSAMPLARSMPLDLITEMESFTTAVTTKLSSTPTMLQSTANTPSFSTSSTSSTTTMSPSASKTSSSTTTTTSSTATMSASTTTTSSATKTTQEFTTTPLSLTATSKSSTTTTKSSTTTTLSSTTTMPSSTTTIPLSIKTVP